MTHLSQYDQAKDRKEENDNEETHAGSFATAPVLLAALHGGRQGGAAAVRVTMIMMMLHLLLLLLLMVMVAGVRVTHVSLLIMMSAQ